MKRFKEWYKRYFYSKQIRMNAILAIIYIGILVYFMMSSFDWGFLSIFLIVGAYAWGHENGKKEGFKEGYYYHVNRERMDENQRKHPIGTDEQYCEYQEKELWEKLH